MNQQADSRKKNLLDAAMKPRNCQQGWFLSHTCEHDHNRNENRLNGLIDLLRTLCTLALKLDALPFKPFALDPSQPQRHRLLQRRHILREQKESERQHPESEHRQEAEDTAEDQQERERYAGIDRRRLAQPAHELRRTRRQFSLEPGKMPVQFLLMLAQ